MASAPHAAQQRRDSQAALMAMGAYERHRRLLASLAHYGAGARGQDPPAPAPLPSRTDADVLRDSFRFIRSDAEDAAGDPWEVRLARRYYAQLYREYAIADLSRHRESRLGLRWRTQREVVAGKGQFSCGAVVRRGGVGWGMFGTPRPPRACTVSCKGLHMCAVGSIGAMSPGSPAPCWRFNHPQAHMLVGRCAGVRGAAWPGLVRGALCVQ